MYKKHRIYQKHMQRNAICRSSCKVPRRNFTPSDYSWQMQVNTIMLSLTILSILTISSNATIHPSTIQSKGFRNIQQGFTQNEIQKLEHIVRQDEKLQKLSLLLLSFRGGAEFSSGNNTLKDDQGDQDDSNSNLWGSISSAFQMNIDAKDELLTEAVDDLESADDESQDDVTDEEESSLSSDEDESIEEEEITITNELSDETEEDSDIHVHEDEYTTEEVEDLDEEQSVEETMNDVNLTVEVVHEDQDVDEFDEEDEYDVEEVEDSIEVTNASDSEQEDSDGKQEDNLDNAIKDDTLREDVEIMDEADEYISTDTEPDEETGHVSVFEDVDSTTSDSEVLPADTTYQMPTESLEEIVKKEWDMIPETEVEDEGKENELRKGSKRENQKNAKKKSKKKKEQRHEKEQKDVKTKSNDEKKKKKASQPIISQRRNEESPKQTMKEPSQVMKEAIMKSTPSQNTQQRSQESPFISSGLVSNFVHHLLYFVLARFD